MNVNSLSHWFEVAFTWTWTTSLHASVLILLVIAVKIAFDNWLRPTWRYALGFLVLIRLLENFARVQLSPSLLPAISGKHETRRRIAMVAGYGKTSRGVQFMLVLVVASLCCCVFTRADGRNQKNQTVEVPEQSSIQERPQTEEPIISNSSGNNTRFAHIRDITFFKGQEPFRVAGTGVVSGLIGTGDEDTDELREQMSEFLQKYGVFILPQNLEPRNIAVVLVETTLSISAKSGDRFDVNVRALGGAKSLQGGFLNQTILNGPDGKPYAIAQGPIEVPEHDPDKTNIGDDEAGMKDPGIGRVKGGMIVEKRRVVNIVQQENTIALVPREKNRRIAHAIAEAINREYPDSAQTTEVDTVRVRIPEEFVDSPLNFAAHLEAIEISLTIPRSMISGESEFNTEKANGSNEPKRQRYAHIGDWVSAKRMRPHELTGIGVVSGLRTTGNESREETLRNLPEEKGQNPKDRIPLKEGQALAYVTASLEVGATSKGRVHARLKAMDGSHSLEGGILEQTILNGVNGERCGLAQGAIMVGGFFSTKTTGIIRSGAVVEKLPPNQIEKPINGFELSLLENNSQMANRIVEALNGRFPGCGAQVINASAVYVWIPEAFLKSPVHFYNFLKSTQISYEVQDSKASDEAQDSSPDDTRLESTPQASNNDEEYQVPNIENGMFCGRVVGPDGNGIKGARVEWAAWNRNTDSEGRFSISDVESPVSCLVHAEGYLRKITDPLLADGTEHEIVLRRSPVIRGRVIDHETKTTIPNMRVYDAMLLGRDGKPSIHWNEPWDRWGDPVEGKDGRFEFFFEHRMSYDTALLVESDGYEPAFSRRLSEADNGELITFELRKANPITCQVLTPSGEPAHRAQVFLWTGELNLSSIRGAHRFNTDTDGSFQLPYSLDGDLVVTSVSGYAEVPVSNLKSSTTIRLKPWGRVQGQWRESLPWPKDQMFRLQPINWAGKSFGRRLYWNLNSQSHWFTGGGGLIEFERIPAGEYWLLKMTLIAGSKGSGWYPESHKIPITVKPGETTRVGTLGKGRSVVGRIVMQDLKELGSWSTPFAKLILNLPPGPSFDMPERSQFATDEEHFLAVKRFQTETKTYWLSAEGKERRRAERVYFGDVSEDGSFRIDDVPGGTYTLRIAPGSEQTRNGWQMREVVVPEFSENTDGRPVDLGPVEMELATTDFPLWPL